MEMVWGGSRGMFSVHMERHVLVKAWNAEPASFGHVVDNDTTPFDATHARRRWRIFRWVVLLFLVAVVWIVLALAATAVGENYLLWGPQPTLFLLTVPIDTTAKWLMFLFASMTNTTALSFGMFQIRPWLQHELAKRIHVQDEDERLAILKERDTMCCFSCDDDGGTTWYPPGLPALNAMFMGFSFVCFIFEFFIIGWGQFDIHLFNLIVYIVTAWLFTHFLRPMYIVPQTPIEINA